MTLDVTTETEGHANTGFVDDCNTKIPVETSTVDLQVKLQAWVHIDLKLKENITSV